MKQQSKKEETKWKLLVGKVIAAKNAAVLAAFPAGRRLGSALV